MAHSPAAREAVRAEQARISSLRHIYWGREASGQVVRPGRWEKLGDAQRVVDLAGEVNVFHPCMSIAEQVARLPERYQERVRTLLGA